MLTPKRVLLLVLSLVLLTTAFAQDKATLDLLVQKGVITQAEADQVAKQSTLVVRPKNSNVKVLTISGTVQTQFDYISVDVHAGNTPNPQATQEFLLRRANIDLQADLGSGFLGQIKMDFAAGQGSTAQTGSGNRQLFDTVLIQKTFEDVGTLQAGYQKVFFVEEQLFSSSKINVIEDSIATRYFSNSINSTNSGNLALSGRRVGLYWLGNTPIKGLSYRAALTNGEQSVTGFTAGGNQMAYLGSLLYDGTFEAIKYTLGINTIYSQNANTIGFGPVSDMFGLNPFVQAKWGRASLMSEFIWAGVENGSGPGTYDDVFGINFTPSYRFADDWEATLRFSYLNTGGRGVSTSAIYDAPNAGLLFNSVYSIYAGLTWFIMADNLKLMAGYEWLSFEGALSVPNGFAQEQALRLRLQLMF